MRRTMLASPTPGRFSVTNAHKGELNKGELNKGELKLLQRLLVRRFGLLPEWAEAKLAAAELAQLEAWGERVLDAATLEAVFAEE